jgi:MSHA pilin protein MshC
MRGCCTAIPFCLSARCLRFLLHCAPTFSVHEWLLDMRLSLNKIEAATQQSGLCYSTQADVCLSGLRTGDDQRGFTLIELIMVMIIVGILAVFVAPRFFDANVFKSRGFADQVQATLRYAQKEAIAQRGFVCVALASNSITLNYGPTAACATGGLPLPAGGNSITAPAGSGITLTYNLASFAFDALGRNTSAQIVVSVSGATNNIVVEAETGYVHSP